MDAPDKAPFLIDFVGDVVCPWCYLGWVRLRAALAMRPDFDARVLWRPYQLQFDIPEAGIPYAQFMDQLFPDRARRRDMDVRLTDMGKADGVQFRFDLIPMRPNTNAAHRLIRWAENFGLADQTAEAVMRAHFTEGRDIGKPEVLAQIAGETGMGEDEAREMLASGDGRAEIDEECRMIAQAGVNGVPFTLMAGRVALSGAETPDRLLFAIDKALEAQAEQP
jgi:predicted DsbA family dithiol-disulfide isomerase